jgi:nucleoside-diphosphate-sugar epimerase
LNKVLVTGGAGFVGSELVRLLLDNGYKVAVLDNLRFGGESLIGLVNNPSLEVIVGDIRNRRDIKKGLKNVDAIIHLAAIVGYPACDQEPELARQTNVEGTLNLLKEKGKRLPLIFASTGSNYGILRDKKCTEESKLNPLTTYGRTKTEAEKACLDSGAIVLRFATGFGLSLRLRLDLMPNSFVYHQVRDRHLVVYESNFRRTFIHVSDMARAFLFMTENYGRVKERIYNIGHESMNLTKKDIALTVKDQVEKICKFTPYVHFADFGKDADQRDYEVDYDRIRKEGFSLQKDLKEALAEVIRAVRLLNIKSAYGNV